MINNTATAIHNFTMISGYYFQTKRGKTFPERLKYAVIHIN